MINPSGFGEILVEFDPKNRQHFFHKKITVKSNAENDRVVLSLKGMIEANNSSYRYKIGSLKLKSKIARFDTVFDSKVAEMNIPTENSSKNRIEISITSKPDYLEVHFPEIIQANEKQVISLKIDPQKVTNYGFFKDQVVFRVLENNISIEKAILIEGKITQDFSNLTTKEKKNAPIAFFPKKRFNIKPNSINDTIHVICENRGKSTLEIKSMQPSKNVEIIRNPSTIDPLDKKRIVVISNPIEGKGNQSLQIVTNDPLNSVQTISFIGNKKQTVHAQLDIIKKINLQETKTLIDQFLGDENFIILDVRTAPEFDRGHIENAINIDLSDPNFKSRIELLDKDKTYLVYCKKGARSARACRIMRRKQFKKLYDFEAGFDAWIQ